eukprot:SAG31_NODE_806_length_11957_cov_2.232670_15_plen_163_part_00
MRTFGRVQLRKAFGSVTTVMPVVQGLLTTVTDLTNFYQTMLSGGCRSCRPRRILQEETVAAAITSQTRGLFALSSLPLETQHTIWGGLPSSTWGLGFRLNDGEKMFGTGPLSPSDRFGALTAHIVLTNAVMTLAVGNRASWCERLYGLGGPTERTVLCGVEH